MPWVKSYWRRPPGSSISPISFAGGDFNHFQEIRIVASLIEKGVCREDLSTRYSNLWDEAQQWIIDKKPDVKDALPSDDKSSLPAGAKWITDRMYEFNGEYYFRRR